MLTIRPNCANIHLDAHLGIVIGCLKLETKPDAIKTKKIYFIFVVSFTGLNERHDCSFVQYWLAEE